MNVEEIEVDVFDDCAIVWTRLTQGRRVPLRRGGEVKPPGAATRP